MKSMTWPVSILMLISISLRIEANGEISPLYKECHEKSTNCVGAKVPANYWESPKCTGKDCDYVGTFRYDEVSERVNVTLYSRMSGGYVAMGVSIDQKMGDDIVVVCSVDEETNSVDTYLAFNLGRHNHRISPDSNSSHNSKMNNNSFLESKINNSFLNSTSGIMENGLFCEFSIGLFIVVLRRTQFDLRTRPYHFILAGGSAGKDFIRYHDARIATRAFRWTSKVVQVNTTVAIFDAEQIHAGYMIFCWIVWLPIGMILSRFYKETWTHTQVWNWRLWLAMHATCMIFALVMSITGYVLVMYDRNQMLPYDEPARTHGKIGLVAMSLLLFECLFGWYRPSGFLGGKFAAKLHCVVGITCFLLGIGNILWAPVLTQNILPCSTTYIVLTWLVIYIFLCGGLATYIFWTDYHLGLGGYRAFVSCPLPVGCDEEAVRPTLRKGIIGGITLVSLIFAFLAISTMKSDQPCPPMINEECSKIIDKNLEKEFLEP